MGQMFVCFAFILNGGSFVYRIGCRQGASAQGIGFQCDDLPSERL
jgi:hypothetical protein